MDPAAAPAASSPASPSATAQWKPRPVFISSTFRDMQWERDYLNRRVFPRLAEELAKRHHHLEPIDLRLGVEAGQAGSEEARELLVLKVCLDEIKRSRPFLLVLLGDRYGWVPPPERIETAAREQGMETSPAGKSVTALEIEFGILRDPENPDQKSRSLFFFRQPLPYEDMPEAVRADYSDAHSPDPQVRAGHAKLTDLKAALQRDPELAGRLHDYSVGWDAERQKVTALEAFGDLVFEKLWAVIDAETKDWATKPAPTWEEQERAGLAEFIEHRSRGFTGRADVLQKLRALATDSTEAPPTGPATSSTETPATETPKHRNTGLLTGRPGSGKSAVFAQLHRDLEKDSSLLILANAAGGTQRGSSVDSMLRRWIGELAVAAGVENPLPANASNDDVEKAFYSLLHRVSAQRRVIVLLDALDQFEPTPRGRHITWFKPQQWPPNARLIATATPGPASAALLKGSGTAELDLPPLTAADAKAIGTHVWGRYHRTLNPAVLAVLIEKNLPDGTPACGNPLWLTLALEQLNLLDADDFARAERDFTGSPGERLAALLLDTARRMPPDIEALYGWLLEQNEKAFGLPETRAFATAIALSRSGWRESDLLDLVQRLAPQFGDIGSKIGDRGSKIGDHPSSTDPAEVQPEESENHPPSTICNLLSPLALASLRRSFRTHLVRRGEHEQLDFFHAQMRRAVLDRCVPDETQRRTIHAAISDFLESLPPSDPLIRFERMSQLIGERNATRAGAYYATVQADAGDELTSERLGSTWTIVEWIVQAEAAGMDNVHLAWITSWLADPGLSHDQVYRLTRNFQFGLFKRMENDVALPTRQRLVEAVRAALQLLVAADSSNAEWQCDLSVCQRRIGYLLQAQGDLAGAQGILRESLAAAERLAGADSSNARWHRELSFSRNGIGYVLHAQGDLDGALRAYRENQSGMQRLVAADPSNAERQRDLSFCQMGIGCVLRDQGDLDGALRAFRDSLAVVERLAAAHPSSLTLQADLSLSQMLICGVLQAQGDFDGALRAIRGSLAVAERLAAADPSNRTWQYDLSFKQMTMGSVLRAQGDVAGALKQLRISREIAVSLSARFPDDPEIQWLAYKTIAHLIDIQISRNPIRVTIIGVTGALVLGGWKLLLLSPWFWFLSLPIFLLAIYAALTLLGSTIGHFSEKSLFGRCINKRNGRVVAAFKRFSLKLTRVTRHPRLQGPAGNHAGLHEEKGRSGQDIAVPLAELGRRCGVDLSVVGGRWANEPFPNSHTSAADFEHLSLDGPQATGASPWTEMIESQESSSGPIQKTVIRSIRINQRVAFGEVARKYDVTVEHLNDINALSLSDGTVLAKGSELYVPVKPKHDEPQARTSRRE